jgi:hypothetical protein
MKGGGLLQNVIRNCSILPGGCLASRRRVGIHILKESNVVQKSTPRFHVAVPQVVLETGEKS